MRREISHGTECHTRLPRTPGEEDSSDCQSIRFSLSAKLRLAVQTTAEGHVQAVHVSLKVHRLIWKCVILSRPGWLVYFCCVCVCVRCGQTDHQCVFVEGSTNPLNTNFTTCEGVKAAPLHNWTVECKQCKINTLTLLICTWSRWKWQMCLSSFKGEDSATGGLISVKTWLHNVETLFVLVVSTNPFGKHNNIPHVTL